MSKLTAQDRKDLPRFTFALPEGTVKNGGKPAFPINDKEHAHVAESYASKEEKSGDITPAQESRVDAKAARMLGGSKRGTSQDEPRWKSGRGC